MRREPAAFAGNVRPQKPYALAPHARRRFTLASALWKRTSRCTVADVDWNPSRSRTGSGQWAMPRRIVPTCMNLGTAFGDDPCSR
jgi:hypothetical protein